MQATSWWSNRKNVRCWLLPCRVTLVSSPEWISSELRSRMSWPWREGWTHVLRSPDARSQGTGHRAELGGETLARIPTGGPVTRGPSAGQGLKGRSDLGRQPPCAGKLFSLFPIPWENVIEPLCYLRGLPYQKDLVKNSGWVGSNQDPKWQLAWTNPREQGDPLWRGAQCCRLGGLLCSSPA